MTVVAVLVAGAAAVLGRFNGPLAAALAAVSTAVLLPLAMDRVRTLTKSGLDRELLSQETTVWCPVSEATDPVRLGVHPALNIKGSRPRRMPRYVQRDVDDDLATALRSERLVVLVGESAAGKSRVAFEAIHRELPGHRLLVPRSAGSLRRLADAGCVLRKTVVLLDDLDRYLGADGIDLALLDRLAGPDGDLVALVTMRTGAYASYATDRAPTLPKDDMRAIRGLLDSAQILRLSRRWSEAELGRASELARVDPDIRRALAATSYGFGLAEFLAAAPKLWERWRDGQAIDVQPAGAAIVSAAVDCRRVGFARPVTKEVLGELHRVYLDEPTAALLGPDAFEAGLTWATTPVHATSALLMPVDGGYRVFDYLVDRAEDDPSLPGVPHAVWDGLIRLLLPTEVWRLGITAYYAGLYDTSRQAFERSVDVAADADAFAAAASLHGLGLLAWQENRQDDAEAYLRRAVDVVGDGLARAAVENSLGHLLVERGVAGEARELLERAASLGYLPAVTALGRLLFDQGDQAGAEDTFRRAATAGSAYGAIFLGYLLAERGDIKGAQSAYRRAYRRGSVEGAARLGKLLLRNGDTTDAVEYLLAAARAGDTDAANDLGSTYKDLGRVDEAKRWLAYGADRGDAAAAYNLANLLQQEGDNDQAEIRFRQSARSGGLVAAINLATILFERGESMEALYWLRTVIDTPTETLASHEAELGQDEKLQLMAMLNLANMLSRLGELGDAKKWFERAAATGDPDAIAQHKTLLSVLEAALDKPPERPEDAINKAAFNMSLGMFAEAEGVLRPLAEAGNEDARYWLAACYAHQGADGDAAEILETLVHMESLAKSLAVAALAVNVGRADLAKSILARFDATQTAKAAYDFASILRIRQPDQDPVWLVDRAAEGGHPAAMNEIAARLLVEGRVEEAEALLRRAAETGDHLAEYNLGYHLSHTGRPDDAEVWYRRAANSGRVDAQVNLALLLIRQGRLAEAEALLLRAAATDDHDAECNLGAMYASVGRKADATTWLKRAADAGHELARALLRDLSE